MDPVKEGFKTAITRIFNNWSGLKLAVEYGMGGRNGQKIAMEIMNYVYEYCIQNDNISNTELEDLLEELLDQELNTVCEDNSISEISAQLLKYLILCKEGKFTEVEIQLNQLPQKLNWLDPSVPVMIKRTDDDSSSEDEDDDDNDEQMDIDMTQGGSETKNCQQSSSNEVENEIEPGWTLVKGKHKR